MQASMDYGKAFTFPQLDADWIKKWAIAGGLSLIPIIGPIMVMGYALEITRRVITDNPQLLPEWADFGGIAKQGAYAFVTVLVYNIPTFIFVACAQLPNALLPAILASADSDTADMLVGASSAFMFLTVCCSCLLFIYAILAGLVVPAALGRVAATGELGAAFRIQEVMALVRAQPAVYLIIMLIGAVAMSIAATVGVILCVIGSAFTTAYVALVNAHLVGQAYRAASAPKP